MSNKRKDRGDNQPQRGHDARAAPAQPPPTQQAKREPDPEQYVPGVGGDEEISGQDNKVPINKRIRRNVQKFVARKLSVEGFKRLDRACRIGQRTTLNNELKNFYNILHETDEMNLAWFTEKGIKDPKDYNEISRHLKTPQISERDEGQYKITGSHMTEQLYKLYVALFKIRHPDKEPPFESPNGPGAKDNPPEIDYAPLVYLAHLLYSYPNTEAVCNPLLVCYYKDELITPEQAKVEMEEPTCTVAAAKIGKVTPAKVGKNGKRTVLDANIEENEAVQAAEAMLRIRDSQQPPRKRSRGTGQRGGRKRSKTSKITKGKCKYTYKCKPHKKKQLCTYTYKCPSKKSKGSKRGKCKYTYKCKLHKKKQLCKYTYKCSKKSV